MAGADCCYFFGVVYQFAEGRSIKEIARYFNKDFTTVDGFTSCYVAFYRIISFGTGTLLSEIYFIRKREFLFLKVWDNGITYDYVQSSRDF